MFSTVDLLLDSMSHPGSAGRENLTINLNHLVTELVTDGSRVTGVVCQDLLSNERRTFRGKIVVLSAGLLGSTRIALQSELHDPNGLIGRGLTDHPNFFKRFEWQLGAAPMTVEDHAKLSLRHVEASTDHHAYNIELMVNFQYWDRRVADEDIWRHLVVQPMDRIGIDVQFFFTSALNDANYVRLDVPRRSSGSTRSSTTRPAGTPTRRPTSRPASSTSSLRGAEPTYATDVRYFGGAQIGHSAGTLRMGDEDSAVVDDKQRFHAYDNLYVADLSVFPSVLAAKPSLTLAALSLRLADTILGELPERGAVATGVRGRALRARDRAHVGWPVGS